MKVLVDSSVPTDEYTNGMVDCLRHRFVEVVDRSSIRANREKADAVITSSFELAIELSKIKRHVVLITNPSLPLTKHTYIQHVHNWWEVFQAVVKVQNLDKNI